MKPTTTSPDCKPCKAPARPATTAPRRNRRKRRRSRSAQRLRRRLQSKDHCEVNRRLTKFTALAKEKSLDRSWPRRQLLLKRCQARSAETMRSIPGFVDGKLDATFSANAKPSDRLSNRFRQICVDRDEAVDLVRRLYRNRKAARRMRHQRHVQSIGESADAHQGSSRQVKWRRRNCALLSNRVILGKRRSRQGQDITYSLNAILAKLDKHTGYIRRKWCKVPHRTSAASPASPRFARTTPRDTSHHADLRLAHKAGMRRAHHRAGHFEVDQDRKPMIADHHSHQRAADG